MDIDGIQVRMFPNDLKERPEQPDYTGKHTHQNVDYKVSGWVNDFKNKKGSYITIKFSKLISKEEIERRKTEGDTNVDELPF
tara:strand:+ start:272 stop:517 length:246 start_codon:yes stop_codon:yes gene_type:complete